MKTVPAGKAIRFCDSIRKKGKSKTSRKTKFLNFVHLQKWKRLSRKGIKKAYYIVQVYVNLEKKQHLLISINKWCTILFLHGQVKTCQLCQFYPYLRNGIHQLCSFAKSHIFNERKNSAPYCFTMDSFASSIVKLVKTHKFDEITFLNSISFVSKNKFSIKWY